MRKFMICLCAVYLIGSFQSVGTAAELEGLVVYFAFEEGTGKAVKDLSGNKQDGKLEGIHRGPTVNSGRRLISVERMGSFGLSILTHLSLPMALPLPLGLNPL